MPARRICLDCRTLLGEGEACDAGADRAVSLDDAAGREALIVEVWGRRRGARGIGLSPGEAVAGSVGVGAFCGLFAYLYVPALAALGFGLVGSLVWHQWERYAVNRPSGGRPLRLFEGPPVVGGVARGAAACRAPVTDTPCLGYGLELRTRGILGEDVLLRDGWTSGFEIVGDDGRTVRVPAGRIRLGGAQQMVPAQPALLEAYLEGVDPQRQTEEPFGPFPFRSVAEPIVADGGRIEVFGKLDEVPDSSAPAAGYRDRPATFLVPSGIPLLWVC